jgi:hypothetical protein
MTPKLCYITLKYLLITLVIVNHREYHIITSYFLWFIILSVNIDVSRHILVIDTFLLAKGNMGRREYKKSEKI